jgi:hypothetical protein
MMKRLTVLLGYCAALTACGGGSGGGDDGGSFGGSGSSQTVINAGNAVNVTAQAFSAIVDTGIIGSFGRETARLLGLGIAGGGTMTQILFCDTGSLTYTWNDTDSSRTLSAGDSFTLSFANCRFDDLQIVANGPAGLVVQQVLGGFASLQAPYDFRGAYAFNQTDITYQGDKWVVQGDMTVRFNSSDGIQSQLELGGSSLVVQQDGISGQWQVTTYSVAQTDNTNTREYRFRAGQQTLDSTFIPGEVIFQTTADFTGVGDTNPAAGQLRIDGGNRSSVLATAVDTTNVQLAVDSDGDGVRERTITVTWSQLGF